MSEQNVNTANDTANIYEDVADWHVNTGEEQIVAKRQPGRFRLRKWLSMTVWLPFFLGPYLRWEGQQAILFDIPQRQFRLFDITIFPQDIWMLSLTLLFFAILLAAVTSVAGRVFCGYFCFQTVWTDIYTLIETKLEGDSPQKARKFKQAPWNFDKTWRVLTKHSLWIAIALLTGISFTNWFTDAYQNWANIVTLQAPLPVWGAIAVFGVFTYGFAGFMREQVCFWLCPYARLQGVMYDQDTVLPAYDAERGEPRGKLKKGEVDSSKGSCIDCKVCVAVCPTGIDIRKGQQEGCITCGLCIDACDSIMDKVKQPRGLIRYASYKELHHDQNVLPMYKRPRVVIYSLILLVALSGIFYGFSTLSPTEFKVVHERQPLYVRLSDGSIQNKYTLKLLNKTQQPITVRYSVSGLEGAQLYGLDEVVIVEPGRVVPITALVRAPSDVTEEGLAPITFEANVVNQPQLDTRYHSMFMAPE
jgi:cytochrome c oxidase accessory protein FixG